MKHSNTPAIAGVIFILVLAFTFICVQIDNKIDRLERWVESVDNSQYESISDIKDRFDRLNRTNDRLDKLEYEVYQKDIEDAIVFIASNPLFSQYTFEGIYNGKPRFSTEFGIDGYKSILVDVKNRVIIKE